MNKILSVVALVGMLAASMAAFAVPAEDPSPRYNFKHAGWWYGRFDRLCELAATNGPAYKVAFIGDSITENWEAPGTNVWNQNFVDEKYRAICLGFGGDRTDHVLWRVENGQLNGLNPKAIVLLIGANNIFARKEREEPPADTVRAIAKIIKAIQKRCPDSKIILCAVIPANEKPDDETRLRGVRTNEQLKRLADGERVLWLDFGAKLLEPDGTLTKETSPDLVHPSEKGYVIWTAMIRPYLDWCLGYSQTRPEGVAFEKDARSAVWTSECYAAKRNEIFANPEHYYDCVFIGDQVKGLSELEAHGKLSDKLLPGCKVLDFPFDFRLSVQDVAWAVENAGLFDGYSSRAIVLSADLWKEAASKGEAKAFAAEVKKLVEAIRLRQAQAKLVLMPVDSAAPAAAEINESLRALSDLQPGELLSYFKKRAR